MESLRKSFKSYSSCKHMAAVDLSDFELILDGPGLQGDSKSDESDGPRMLGEPGIEFRKVSQEEASAEGPGYSLHWQALEDPPSRLIRWFLHQQRASGDVSLDMDLEMEELRGGDSWRDLPKVADSPPRQSQDGSQPPIPTGAGPGTPQRRHKGSPSHDRDGNSVGNREEEVVKYTSSAAFQQKSSLLCTKTQSWLMDPPKEPHHRSGRIPQSSQLRSGMLGRAGDEEEDDLFLEEDMPEEFKKSQFDAMTLL